MKNQSELGFMMNRKYDIQELNGVLFTLYINGQSVTAAEGETVLTVLNAVGLRKISCNDSQNIMGTYCGMGVCHSCLVNIDGRYKRRACQTVVQPGMRVETMTNRLMTGGLS